MSRSNHRRAREAAARLPAEAKRRIRELCSQGKTSRQIAAETGWDVSTVYAVLKEEPSG